LNRQDAKNAKVRGVFILPEAAALPHEESNFEFDLKKKNRVDLFPRHIQSSKGLENSSYLGVLGVLAVQPVFPPPLQSQHRSLMSRVPSGGSHARVVGRVDRPAARNGKAVKIRRGRAAVMDRKTCHQPTAVLFAAGRGHVFCLPL
jgi:hypothetical protein